MQLELQVLKNLNSEMTIELILELRTFSIVGLGVALQYSRVRWGSQGSQLVLL